MALHACYVVHNAAAELRASILSVKAYVDHFVIVDSAFVSNPAAPISTDDTHYVAEQACRGVPMTYLQPGVRLPEDVARNLYLAEVPVGDWCLLIDADERLYGDHVAVDMLLGSLRAGLVSDPALQLRVYTTAVLAPLDAPDIDPTLYGQAPRISTWGWMPKLVRSTPGLAHRRVEVVPGVFTHHGIYDGETALHEAARIDEPFLINDHAGQGYAAYQHDFAWEQAQRTGVTG